MALVLTGCNLGSSTQKDSRSEPPLPKVISFSPSSGSTGTLLTLSSTDVDLTNPASVKVGGHPALVLSSTSTSATVFVAGGSAGSVNVEVVPAVGSSVTAQGEFTLTSSADTPISQQQGGKLVGTGAVGSAAQGMSMALSADGKTAIVGAPFDDSEVGAAWVFTRSGTTWTQQGSKLVGTGAVGAATQGVRVALSADGNTALVGGGRDNNEVGAVWVFTRSGTTWTQQGSKLVGTGAVGAAYQGGSVALSADGNTALIGGPGDDNDAGATWVFTRSGVTWAQQGAKLVGAGAVGVAVQGTSIALSADGNTALVGGSGDNTDAGAAWVFARSGTTWTQQGNKLVGTGAVMGGTVPIVAQGGSVALSKDGNTAIVGGFGDNDGVGAAWVFTRSGTTWTQQGNKLVGTGVAGLDAFQGVSVALSGDGHMALIGGLFDDNGVGAVWVFTRSGTAWTQQGSKLVGTGAVMGGTVPIVAQGGSVALSADGKTAIVGGFMDDNEAGAAWIFTP